MKPILFKTGETEFTTNGLGRLGPINCTVTEERNGQFELEMDIDVQDKHYKDIAEGRIIYAIHDDTKLPQPFDIYKISRPLNGVVTVNAQHVTYRTAKTVIMPCSSDSCPGAMVAIGSNIAGTSQFTLSTDITRTGSFQLEQPETMRNVLGGRNGSLLDVYGGEYIWDHFTIQLKSQRGTDTDVTLRYGKNITDLKKTTDMSGIWTGVAPYWMGSDGLAQDIVTLPEKAVYSSSVNSYAYKMVIPLDASQDFQSKPTEAQLRARAQSYISSNAPTGIPSSIDISFVQLWQTDEYKNIAALERLKLCDTLTIKHEKLGISNTAKIVKTVYDVINERYESMTIGDVRTSLGDTIRAAADEVKDYAVSKTAMQRALEAAQKLITGGLGGHVVINTDEDGHPNEVLIMDTDDINTAVKVLRMNMLGIGFSLSGYNGPFTSAWTIDGKFVADFITAGTLNAAIIKAGILSDEAGKNFWNMQTGEFRLAAEATVGGKTVDKIADDAVSGYDTALNQQKIFNKLTNNGETQGIYLSGGKLYINGTYIQTGTITIKKGTKTTFSANADTGVVNIVADSFSLSNGDTISSIAEDKASAAVNAQTQQSIFNKLTNNGQTQGIYLSGGKVYINAAYIATGTLADAGNNTTFNLSTGALTMKKGEINIGDGAFKVSTAGKLSCTGAEISGDILSGSKSGSSIWMHMQSGKLKGGKGSSQYGYIEYSAETTDLDTGSTYTGLQIQGSMLRISTSRIAVARSSNVGTTATWCYNGKIKYVKDVTDNGDGTITWTWDYLDVINGFITAA